MPDNKLKNMPINASSENSFDYKEGERITYGCIIGNLFLCVFKYFAGYVGKSQAMISDAIHSASDVIATLVVLFGLKITQKPHDKSHNFGHGKMEFVSATVVGAILVSISFKIGFSTITSIIDNTFTTPSFVAVLAAAVSISVKEFMYRITMQTAVKLNSEALKANAWDHRSDAYSSIGTLVGISGSIIGKHLGIFWMQYLDPIAGFIVALLIFKVSLEILFKAISGLMDAAPDKETVGKIQKTIKSYPHVHEITYIKSRYTGPLIWIDMAVSLDSNLSVKEAHTITENLEKKIRSEISNIDHIVIHIDPFESV